MATATYRTRSGRAIIRSMLNRPPRLLEAVMSKRTLLLAGPIALAGCTLALAAQKGAPAPDHGVAARFKMARDAFNLIDQKQKGDNPADSDTMFTWAKRLMEC